MDHLLLGAIPAEHPKRIEPPRERNRKEKKKEILRCFDFRLREANDLIQGAGHSGHAPGRSGDHLQRTGGVFDVAASITKLLPQEAL